MIRVIKKIFAFSGKRKGLLIRSIFISFIGAVFSALQFLALMVVLDALQEKSRFPYSGFLLGLCWYLLLEKILHPIFLRISRQRPATLW